MILGVTDIVCVVGSFGPPVACGRVVVLVGIVGQAVLSVLSGELEELV